MDTDTEAKKKETTDNKLQSILTNVLNNGQILKSYIENIADRRDGIPIEKAKLAMNTFFYFQECLTANTINLTEAVTHCQSLIEMIEQAWAAKRCGLNVKELSLLSSIVQYNTTLYHQVQARKTTNKDGEPTTQLEEEKEGSNVVESA